MKCTKYYITFENGQTLEHIDIFNSEFNDVIEGLMLINAKKREDIKFIFITYDYQLEVK